MSVLPWLAQHQSAMVARSTVHSTHSFFSGRAAVKRACQDACTQTPRVTKQVQTYISGHELQRRTLASAWRKTCRHCPRCPIHRSPLSTCLVHCSPLSTCQVHHPQCPVHRSRPLSTCPVHHPQCPVHCPVHRSPLNTSPHPHRLQTHRSTEPLTMGHQCSTLPLTTPHSTNTACVRYTTAACKITN